MYFICRYAFYVSDEMKFSLSVVSNTMENRCFLTTLDSFFLSILFCATSIAYSFTYVMFAPFSTYTPADILYACFLTTVFV